MVKCTPQPVKPLSSVGSVGSVYDLCRFTHTTCAPSQSASMGRSVGSVGLSCYFGPMRACASERAPMCAKDAQTSYTTYTLENNLVNTDTYVCRIGKKILHQSYINPTLVRGRVDIEPLFTEASARLQAAGRLVVWGTLAEFFRGGLLGEVVTPADVRALAASVGLDLYDVRAAGLDWGTI